MHSHSFALQQRTLALLALLALSGLTAKAQAPPPACAKYLNSVALSQLRDPSNSIPCLWELAALPIVLKITTASQKGAAVQTGAPTGSPGTTSAVSKATTISSLASEYGGITSSTSNQTVTFQTTLDGIPRVLVDHGKMPYCWSESIVITGCQNGDKLANLNRIGLGVTLNTSNPSQSLTGTATGASNGTTQQVSINANGESRPSLSSAFAKFTLIKGKYALPTDLPAGTDVAAAQAKVHTDLAALPAPIEQEYLIWQACFDKQFGIPQFQGLSNSDKDLAFAKYYTQIVGILFEGKRASTCSPSDPIVAIDSGPTASLTPEQEALAKDLGTYMGTASVFEANFDQALLSAISTPVISLEYDFNTPQNQPSNSTLKVIVGKSFGKAKCTGPQDSTGASEFEIPDPWTITVNAGTSLYNSTPSSSIPGASIWRDFQAGAEIDYAVCTSRYLGEKFGDSTLGLAYYYQDQTSPSILNVTPGTPLTGISFVGLPTSATQVFTKKGPINVAQFKYGFGVGKSVSFPIAVGWSNRTELITHAIWGVQFGVSYDLSSLLGSGGTNNK